MKINLFLLLLLYYAHNISTRCRLYPNSERILMTKMNNVIKNLQKNLQIHKDHKYFLIFFQNFNSCGYNFKNINKILKDYIENDFEEMYNFYILKIRFHTYFHSLNTIDNILHQNIKKLLKEIKKNKKKVVSESNAFYSILISSKNQILVDYVNKKFNLNFLNKKDELKISYYDIRIILETTISEISINILVEYICSLLNYYHSGIGEYNFAIMAKGNGKTFIKEDFYKLQMFIPDSYNKANIQTRCNIGKSYLFEINKTIKTFDKIYTEKNNRKVNMILCKNLEIFYASIIEISLSYDDFFNQITFHYKRGNVVDSSNIRDHNVIELSHFSKFDNYKYVTKIEAISTMIYIFDIHIKININYEVSHKVWEFVNSNDNMSSCEKYILDNKKSKKTIFNLYWYLDIINFKLSDKNRKTELLNYKNHLKFLENINTMLYIFTNDVIFCEIDILNFFDNPKILYFTQTLSLLLEENLFEDFKLYEIINKTFCLSIKDLYFDSIKFYEFNYFEKGVYATNNVMDENYIFIQELFPNIKKTDIFYKEFLCFKDICIKEYSLEDSLKFTGKNLIILIEFSNKESLNIIIRKVECKILEYDKKNSEYTQKIYDIVFSEIVEFMPDSLLIIDENTKIKLENLRKYLWNTWIELKLYATILPVLDNPSLIFNDSCYNHFYGSIKNRKKITKVFFETLENNTSLQKKAQDIICDTKYIPKKIEQLKCKFYDEISVIFKDLQDTQQKFNYFLIHSFYTRR